MMTSENPRGRSFSRHGLCAAGSLSTITTTSRSASMRGSACNSSIWRWNAASAAVSAKTTTGRAVNRNCSGVTSAACRISSSGVTGTVTIRSGGGGRGSATGGGGGVPDPIPAVTATVASTANRLNLIAPLVFLCLNIATRPPSGKDPSP